MVISGSRESLIFSWDLQTDHPIEFFDWNGIILEADWDLEGYLSFPLMFKVIKTFTIIKKIKKFFKNCGLSNVVCEPKLPI